VPMTAAVQPFYLLSGAVVGWPAGARAGLVRTKLGPA
jgi:hypothetical protein